MEQHLEQIVAANLTELRRAREWTQAELAEKINYSDKSVSKWERGEGMPDLKVLVQLAELYDVPLDTFVTPGGAQTVEAQPQPAKRSNLGFRIVVELLAVSVVFLIATMTFVYSTVYTDLNLWILFIWALPVSFLLLALFSEKWGYRVCTTVFSSLLCWTLLTAVYLQLLPYNIWMVFLIGIPAQAAIVLLGQLRRQKQHLGYRRGLSLPSEEE